MIQKIGQITADECNEIRQLNLRKETLEELFVSLTKSNQENSEMYHRIIEDISNTKLLISKWWKQASTKYLWTSTPDGKWQINYDSQEVFLWQDTEALIK